MSYPTSTGTTNYVQPPTYQTPNQNLARFNMQLPGQMNYQNNIYQTKARQMINQFLSNPPALEQLCHKNPELADKILTEDIVGLTKIIQEKETKRIKEQQRIDSEIARLEKNPFDPESQKKIEQMIREKRLADLQKETYEHHPELFVSTEMLYINASVNNSSLQVFVDTGAQTTVISKAFAVRANLMKNVDARFAGLIKGVGEQTSLGRIWNFNLKIQGRFFPISAVVLKEFSHELLLGLDAMKRHKVQIDLGKMSMFFLEQDISVEFLKDQEIVKIPLHEMSKKVQKIMETLGVDDKSATQLLKKKDYDENLVITEHFNKFG